MIQWIQRWLKRRKRRRHLEQFNAKMIVKDGKRMIEYQSEEDKRRHQEYCRRIHMSMKVRRKRMIGM